jgi:O-antigen ligase
MLRLLPFKLQRPNSGTQVAAFCWALACFLPVGMAYLCAAMLILALLATSQHQSYRARWQRLREHPVFWPLCGFLAWALIVLCTQAHFPETPSNTFHAIRIAATIAIVLTLDADESKAAITGYIFGACVVLLIIYINRVVALPHVLGLRDVLHMYGNRSIGVAILLAILGCCAFLCSIGQTNKPAHCLLALVLLIVIPVLIWFLPSRTSLVLMSVCLLVGIVHGLLHKPRWLFSAALFLFVMGYGLSQTSQVQHRFTTGIHELQIGIAQSQASDSEIDLQNSSWGMRYLLYTQTYNMIADRPWTGWGMGGWNQQWRSRTPPSVHAANMPHNDFLWIGAQTGILGMLALLSVVLALALSVIRLRSLAATLSLVSTTALFVAMSFNSALRDAQIGMSVLFIVVVFNAWALSDQTSSKPMPP